MSATLAVPIATWAVLSAAAFLFLWLDRYQLDLLPWLAGVAAWGFAGPAALAAMGVRMPHLLAAPSAGSPIPELWLALPAVVVALPCLGVALPVAAVARSRVLEGPSSGAVFGVTASLAFSLGMHLLVATRASWHPSPAALAFVSPPARGRRRGARGRHRPGQARGASASAHPPRTGRRGGRRRVGRAARRRRISCWSNWGEVGAPCNAALAAVELALLLGVFGLSISYERRVLAGQLAEEVDLGVLPGGLRRSCRATGAASGPNGGSGGTSGVRSSGCSRASRSENTGCETCRRSGPGCTVSRSDVSASGRER